jgi:hypothetical protein
MRPEEAISVNTEAQLSEISRIMQCRMAENVK